MIGCVILDEDLENLEKYPILNVINSWGTQKTEEELYERYNAQYLDKVGKSNPEELTNDQKKEMENIVEKKIIEHRKKLMTNRLYRLREKDKIRERGRYVEVKGDSDFYKLEENCTFVDQNENKVVLLKRINEKSPDIPDDLVGVLKVYSSEIEKRERVEKKNKELLKQVQSLKLSLSKKSNQKTKDFKNDLIFFIRFFQKHNQEMELDGEEESLERIKNIIGKVSK